MFHSCFNIAIGLPTGTMWIAFVQGASVRWIPVHEEFTAIGLDEVSGIMVLHDFTSCDVFSSFVVEEIYDVSDDDLQKLRCPHV